MSTAFHPLKILDVAHETDQAIAVTLEPDPSLAETFAFLPGQHLTFRAEIAGQDVRRNYSICAAPGNGPLRVAIKQVEGGLFSGWALQSLKAGDIIETMAPRGHFNWKFEPEARHHYLAFAAGSGITPVLSLIRTGLAIEQDSRFTLLYGNRSSSSIMFLEELAALKDRYLGRLQIYHFLTSEFDDIELFNGRLDEARIAMVLDSLVDPAAIDVAFICGPGAMMDAAELAMLGAGLSPEHVLTERFSTGEESETERQADRESRRKAQGLRMEVRVDGRRRAIEFDAEKGNILESARASGLPAPYACKAGVCATCRAKLVAGEVTMKKNYGLSPQEVEQGYILTCQSIPAGEGVVVDYDS
jgi:ring-1,2-phenylacetyl-CoA epoxidase subunit PaaE